MASATRHREVNRSAYDEIAGEYALIRGETVWETNLVTSFTERLPPAGVVLDLGCGPAVESRYFRQLGFRVISLDLSIRMLRLAEQKKSRNLIQGELLQLPLAAGSIDGIWCSAALLHVAHDETAAAMREMRRVMTPGGALALITSKGHGDHLEAVSYLPEKSRWYFDRSPEELRQTLLTERLDVVREREQEQSRSWLEFLAVGQV